MTARRPPPRRSRWCASARSARVSCSPAWAWSAPQQPCVRGTTHLPPFLASTRAVARFCGAERDLLDAAREQADAAARAAPSAGDQPAAAARGRPPRGKVGSERLPRGERAGQEPQQARARATAAAARSPGRSGGPPRPGASSARVGRAAAEKLIQRNSRRRGRPGRWRSISALRRLDELAVRHAGRAHRLARAAAEAEVEVLDRRSRSGRCAPRRAT